MHHVFSLKNGIRVVSEPMENRRTVALGVFVKVGSQNENPKNNGISHLIEHMLFKGTKLHSAKDLADVTARMGDDINAFTSKECTALYGMSITENLEEMIRLFAEMITDSLFDPKELAKEKRVVMDEIDMYEDSAEDLVHELLQKRIWTKEPLGYIISGTKSSVKAITCGQIKEYCERYYRPENILISAAGGYCEEAMLQWLENSFSMPRTPGEIALEVKKTMKDSLRLEPYREQFEKKLTVEPVYHRCFVTANKEMEQLHMNLAFPAITVADERRFAYSLFNSILGGSNNSRLFQKIREEEGMAYSVYSYSSAYERAGLFHIDITVQPAMAAEVLCRVIEIVREFRERGVGTEELAMHKQQICTELIMSSESPKTRMESNAKYASAGAVLYSAEEKLEKIREVTCGDIHTLAMEILDLSRCSICIVGKKDSVNLRELKKIWNRLCD